MGPLLNEMELFRTQLPKSFPEFSISFQGTGESPKGVIICSVNVHLGFPGYLQWSVGDEIEYSGKVMSHITIAPSKALIEK